MYAYSFEERLAFSKSQVNESLARILKARLPGVFNVEIAETSEDRQGTDFWAVRDLDLPDLSIDLKVRDKDWSAHPDPRKRADDLALETWSVCGSKVGWTRDETKRTDFVVWYWLDTGRFFIVSFPALCKVFQMYWEKWSMEYRCFKQDSGNWQSECVFVPRAIVMEKLNHWATGCVK